MTRCLTTVALLLCASVAFAQADRNRDQGGITAQDLAKSMTPPADSKEFATRAAAGNLFEIRLSELAQQKAQSQEIKQLAQQLKQEHQQAQDQLKQAAQNISEDLPKLKQVKLDAFQQLEGKAFDNAYAMCQVESHLHSIMMYQNESQNGSDEKIKQYATQTLPKLKQHAGHIARVAQSMQIPVEVLAAGAAGAGDRAVPAAGTIRSDRDRNRAGTGTTTGQDRDK